MKNIAENINNLRSDEEDLRPIVNRLKNELLYCQMRDGHSFVSKLIAVRGDILIFETKSGKIAFNNIDQIESCSVYHPKQNQKASREAL